MFYFRDTELLIILFIRSSICDILLLKRAENIFFASEHEEKVAAMTQENTNRTSEERQPTLGSPPWWSLPPKNTDQVSGEGQPAVSLPSGNIAAGVYKQLQEGEYLRQDIYEKLQTLPIKDQKEILIKAIGSLSRMDKNEVVQETGIHPLTQEATDFVWKVIVSGTVIVFVGSAIGIVAAAFVGINVASLTTVFTAVVAFLGGLLAPSPVQSAVRSITSGFKSSSQADNK
jgi:hypothetical protein